MKFVYRIPNYACPDVLKIPNTKNSIHQLINLYLLQYYSYRLILFKTSLFTQKMHD